MFRQRYNSSDCYSLYLLLVPCIIVLIGKTNYPLLFSSLNHTDSMDFFDSLHTPLVTIYCWPTPTIRAGRFWNCKKNNAVKVAK